LGIDLNTASIDSVRPLFAEHGHHNVERIAGPLEDVVCETASDSADVIFSSWTLCCLRGPTGAEVIRDMLRLACAGVVLLEPFLPLR
jgi:hypothetical protein